MFDNTGIFYVNDTNTIDAIFRNICNFANINKHKLICHSNNDCYFIKLTKFVRNTNLMENRQLFINSCKPDEKDFNLQIKKLNNDIYLIKNFAGFNIKKLLIDNYNFKQLNKKIQNEIINTFKISSIDDFFDDILDKKTNEPEIKNPNNKKNKIDKYITNIEKFIKKSSLFLNKINKLDIMSQNKSNIPNTHKLLIKYSYDIDQHITTVMQIIKDSRKIMVKLYELDKST